MTPQHRYNGPDNIGGLCQEYVKRQDWAALEPCHRLASDAVHMVTETAQAGHDATIPAGLVEITEDRAKALHAAGRRVFAHAFDPFEIDYWDRNGFQQWNKQGFRFEGVRFYTGPGGPVTMTRTPELDAHWKGFYWCNTCSLYAGLESNHPGHDLVKL